MRALYVEASTEDEAMRLAQFGKGHQGAADVVGAWPITDEEWKQVVERLKETSK